MDLLQFRYCPLRALVLAVALACAVDATALDTKVNGRLTFGAAVRTEAPDPKLLVVYNAAVLGLSGLASAGQNTDDANLNFRRGDATTRALKGYLDVSVSEGASSAFVRIKAWHDAALADQDRPWGNNANGYQGGQPIGDNGAARLSRFSGVALADAFVQHSVTVGDAKVMGRLGQQALSWGERAAFVGGLSALNAADQPAMRRAGAAPQEMRRPTPMLFSRVDFAPALGIEAFYTRSFRPSALDMCGTFWAITDYLAEGCDRAFVGAPAVSDRARLASGSYLRRAPSPSANDGAQYGVGLTWKWPALGDVGLCAARYIARTPIPGLYKSTRVGAALIPGDPDGKNLRYFTEHADDIRLVGLNVTRKRGANTWSGELAYRPNVPVQLPPGDVLPAFLSPTAPSLLRADASATAPGAAFSAFDRYRAVQLQAGLQHDWGKLGSVGVTGAFDMIAKHVWSLPDPSVRRYGRPDQFGTGPIKGVCTINSPDAAKQCSFDGYVSPSAYAYRLRVDARFGEWMPGLATSASALFTHEFKGWSYDLLLSEGRKSMNLGVRFDYRQRYLAELAYVPVWGGAYSNQRDKDQLALAVGVKF